MHSLCTPLCRHTVTRVWPISGLGSEQAYGKIRLGMDEQGAGEQVSLVANNDAIVLKTYLSYTVATWPKPGTGRR